MSNLLNRENLLKLYSYEPISGTITNIKNKDKPKVITFSKFEKHPKLSFVIEGRGFRIAAHTVVWLLTHGKLPDGVIVHRDFNTHNFSLNNLMEVGRLTNYALITAYKNLTEFCDIRPNPKDMYGCSVRYLESGRCRYKTFHDLEAAKSYSEKLKNEFRFLIIKLGAIPPC